MYIAMVEVWIPPGGGLPEHDPRLAGRPAT